MALNQKKAAFLPMIPPFAAMACWILTLVFLLTDNRFHLFLKPQFGILIHISLWISIGFALSIIAFSPPPGVRDSLIKGMMLLVPVVFILTAGDRTLGGFALSKRPLAAPETTGQQATSPKAEDLDIPGLSMLTLIQEWDRYKDTRVTLEGVYYEPREKDETLAVVFRYLVSCCAADALPLGVILKKDPDREIRDNDWVRITGVVREDMMDGVPAIFMSLEQIEKKPLPYKSAVYLYP